MHIRDDVAVDRYDALALQPQFAAAAPMPFYNPGSAATCSGTLISPTKVLSAAHCVDSNPTGTTDTNASQVIGVTPTVAPGSASTPSDIASVVNSPLWSNGSTKGTAINDIAVVTLTAPVANITPAPLFVGNFLIATATMVAYGAQGTSVANGLSRANTGLAAQNVIDAVNTSAIQIDVDSPNNTTGTPGLAGEAVRPHAERLETEVLLAAQAASAHDMRPDGVVRVSSPELLTHHLLTPAFAAMHAPHSGIRIELLLEEERGTPPAASGAGYLARSGAPDLGSGCPGHRLVTLLDHGDLWAQDAWLSGHAGPAGIVLRAYNCAAQHLAVCSGAGLAVLPCFRADAEVALHRISTQAPIPAVKAWLGVHRRDWQTPRIRMVLACIAEAECAQASVLNPAEPGPGN